MTHHTTTYARAILEYDEQHEQALMKVILGKQLRSKVACAEKNEALQEFVRHSFEATTEGQRDEQRKMDGP
jgi:hypothetical protein